MIDLKKRENVYPRRQDYKLKSNKTIDKKIVINSIIRYVNNFVGEEAEKSRKDFGKLFGIDTANKDIPNVQILVHDMIHNHHDKNIILVNRCDKYTISYFNNKSENLFYFFDTKEFKNSYNLIQTATYLECNSGNFSDKDAEHLFNEKLSKYFYENHIFCLTLDEFIKEFSPPQYYEKNKLWSMYLDKKEYVAEEASNDEEIKRSPMELHKVNGYWRNQPYGSRKNPRYEKIWVDDFARGGKKVKMAA
jgi:hypothetical protein